MEDYDAEKYNPKLQLVFQGCGGLYNYIFGITKYIQETYTLPQTIYSGVSAGNFAMISLAGDIDMNDVWQNFNLPLLKRVREYKTKSLFNWNDECYKVALNYLSDDIHLKLNNKCHMSISKVNSLWKYNLENEIVSEWKSKEDLLNCVTDHEIQTNQTRLNFFRDYLLCM